MKLCIVIPTKEGNFIHKLLQSTSLLSIDHDIFIVDSCSTNNNYFEKAREYGTIIEGNKNYELGALWKTIDYIGDTSKYTHYLLMQDSMHFIKDLNFISNTEEVFAFRKFNGWDQAKGWHSREVCHEFSKLSGIDVSHENFTMFQCNSFLCTKSHIEQLEDIKLRLFLPVHKHDSMCSERIIGIVFNEMKSNISDITLSHYIMKEFAKRS
jgi:hypothetical protein